MDRKKTEKELIEENKRLKKENEELKKKVSFMKVKLKIQSEQLEDLLNDSNFESKRKHEFFLQERKIERASYRKEIEDLKVTIQNLTIVKVDEARNCLLIKGGIPGPDGVLVTIKTAVKGAKK